MLTNRPDLMLELLAVLVQRAGGSVVIEPHEGQGIVPFDLHSKCDADGRYYLVLESNLSPEQLASRTLGEPVAHA